MELNFETNIKHWLENLEELRPVPTDFCPNLKTDSPVKAVIFDIYGTLIISASGDIDQAILSEENMHKALRAGGFPAEMNKNTAAFLVEQLPLTIKEQQEELKKNGHPFPDVDIFRVWEDMFRAAEHESLLERSGQESLSDVIMVFELLSNKVFPMPGMKEVLMELNRKGIPLGIVSNAQFYTPIIMNYFISGEFLTKQEIELFDPDLSVYSYKELRAKPDFRLFDKINNSLKTKYNLRSSEAVFVGNDMLKDVYTAKKSGLQTALFSGDKRSLRLREDDQRVKGLFPDFFINDLKQLLEIVA